MSVGPSASVQFGADADGGTIVGSSFQSGGSLIRFQAGVDTGAIAPVADAPTGPSVYVGRGAVRTMGGEVLGPSRARYNVPAGPQSSENVLATATDRLGRPVTDPGNLQPTDLIRVNGMEVSVQVAERMGLISRNEVGRTVAGARPETLTASDAAETMTETGEAFASAESETVLTDLASKTYPGTQVAAVNDIVMRGELSEGTIARIASEMRIEPGAAGDRVSKVIAAFETQARSVVGAAGVGDFDDFTAWAHENRPNDLREAMRRHGMERTTEGYRKLANEYVASMADHDPAAILEAEFGSGITAHRTPDGRIYLNLPGRGQVGYREAVRMGLVTVTPRR